MLGVGGEGEKRRPARNSGHRTGERNGVEWTSRTSKMPLGELLPGLGTLTGRGRYNGGLEDGGRTEGWGLVDADD